MSDISNQLIKDSYNYVLQSDLSTGVVYRIGGTIPVNPIFQSGLTVNDSFTYSNGTEQLGFALLTDGTGYAYWGPISAATPSTGVTSITVGTGLSANSSTGAVTIVFTGSTSTSGDYLPLSGGTVTGGTVFQSGLTANTISATTYQNLPYSGTVVGSGTVNYVPVWTGTTGLGNSIIRANSTNVAINTSIDPNVLLYLSTTGATGLQSVANDYGVYGVAQATTGYGVYGLNNSVGGVGAGILGDMQNGTGVRGSSTGNIGNVGVQGMATGTGFGTPINIGGYFSAVGDGTNYSVQLTDGTENVGKVLVSQTADGKANWSDNLNINGLTANTIYSSGQVGIGTNNPNAAAILEIASTTQGVLFPRMTIAERNAITSPPIGLILFVTDGDNEGLYIYKSSGWVQII